MSDKDKAPNLMFGAVNATAVFYEMGLNIVEARHVAVEVARELARHTLGDSATTEEVHELAKKLTDKHLKSFIAWEKSNDKTCLDRVSHAFNDAAAGALMRSQGKGHLRNVEPDEEGGDD